jgi:hypothetical protein
MFRTCLAANRLFTSGPPNGQYNSKPQAHRDAGIGVPVSYSMRFARWSLPLWCRINSVAGALPSVTKVICASTTFRK